MLLHAKTRIIESRDWPINPASSEIFEGMALTNNVVNGVGTVQASAGSSNDVFAGFALNVQKCPTTAKYVELVTIPASPGPYTWTLANTPISPSGSTVSFVSAAGTALSYGSGADNASVSGNVITFDSSDAGEQYYVTYAYSPTVAQLIYLFGDGVVLKREPAAVTNTVGVIRAGLLYTDQFDPSQNWWAANIADLHTGAGGVVTRGGSGSAIHAQVVAAPGVDFPYLGLYFSAP